MNNKIHIKGIPDNMIANNLFPSRLIHPGEMIKDEIDFRGISKEDLAREIDMPIEELDEILDGNHSITTEFAFMLEAALGIEAELWLRLQADYHKQKAMTNPSFLERLSKIRQIASVL